jgi:uncharacterized protein (UPF0548 family)
MLRLRRPGSEIVRRFLASQHGLELSYDGEAGTNRDETPPGYATDHNRQQLGTGAATFERAKEAIRAWKMFPAPWTVIEPVTTPITTGETLAVHVRVLGVWFLNATRIVYTIDEPRRFGFAYGTLPGHAERGEERFTVEWLDDDTVWYDVLAFSRPRHFLARVMYPLARMFQRRFGRQSKASMDAAVRG